MDAQTRVNRAGESKMKLRNGKSATAQENEKRQQKCPTPTRGVRCAEDER
jgi:hypothetical protein